MEFLEFKLFAMNDFSRSLYHIQLRVTTPSGQNSSILKNFSYPNGQMLGCKNIPELKKQITYKKQGDYSPCFLYINQQNAEWHILLISNLLLCAFCHRQIKPYKNTPMYFITWGVFILMKDRDVI